VRSTLTRSLAYLRLNGVKARERPVFIELTRVKQYFDKIKTAETPAERNKTVDKAAAARFIKAGLVSQDSIPAFFPGTYPRTTNSLQAGNDKYDLERAEQQAKERARAHIKFEQTSKDIASKRKVDEVEGVDEDSDSSESDSDSSSESSAAAPEEALPASAIHIKTKKKKKKPKTDNSDSAQSSGNSTPQGTSKKAKAKAAKKAKREKLKVKRERKKQKRSSEK
jgi:exosome complex protein LRP1